MYTNPLLLASDVGAMVTVVMFVIGGLIAIVAIISGEVGKAKRTRQIEESRREIAAYVAEGSMTPDDAFKLMSAGSKKKEA